MKYKKYQHQITLHTVQGNDIEGYNAVAPGYFISFAGIKLDDN